MTSIINYFTKLVTGLNTVGTAWIFFLMLLINIDVLSRYLFNAPIQGVTEVVELSIVGIVFLQISDAIRSGRLTRSDGVYKQILKRWPKTGYFLGIIFDFAGTIFFITILLGAIPRLIEAYERNYFAGNEGLFVVPVWPIRFILVLGSIVAAIQFIILSFNNFKLLSSENGSSS